MIRGKEDKIVITKDEASEKIKVTVEGLWTGKDRHRISRMLLRAMRTAAYQERQVRKQADQTEKKQRGKSEVEQKRLAGLKAYWAAKKLKKLEEEKNNVRGQRKEKSK